MIGFLLALWLVPAEATSPKVLPGLEVVAARELGADPAWAARVAILDPSRVRLELRFDPARPTLQEWKRREPHALLIANGSFYSTDGGVRPTCDAVLRGRLVRGAGCHRQDALVLAARHKADDQPVSRAGQRPHLVPVEGFRPEEWLEAMKSFPALVRRGAAGCSAGRYCLESSRTAAVAELRDGRIALFASQWPAVRAAVARWMAEQLGAVEAVNLDGGPEATLSLAGEAPEESIGTPGVGLPLVLVVLPRE